MTKLIYMYYTYLLLGFVHESAYIFSSFTTLVQKNQW